ncbi:hypothetical protein [Nakamurella flava]|uniref:hypothetical protein n=1 Tax=Nakamurella flava TaxID=2576308 RepID=UPI00140C9796|nr:hypothetical protein [Nakamurella flava]
MNLAAPSTDVSYYTDQLGTGALVAIIVLSVAVWVVFLVAYVQIIRKASYWAGGS